MTKRIITTALLIFAALALSLFTTFTTAKTPVDNSDHSHYSRIILDQRCSYIFGMGMDVLEDKTSTLSINAINSKAHAVNFAPFVKKVANWGFTDSAYWYRTIIVNPGEKRRELILEQTTSWIDSIKLFMPTDESETGFTSVHVGDHLPFKQRPIQHNDFLFPITVEAGQSLPVYLRIKSRAAVVTPLTLWDRDAFGSHDRAIAYYFGAFFGILAIMFVYNLFLFVTLKDNNYLYYIFFIAAVALMYGTSNGLTYMYLWPDDPVFLQQIQTAGLSLFQLGGILFAKSFFETRDRHPYFNKLFQFLITVHSLIIISAFIVDDVIPLANTSVAMVQVNAIILLATGVQAWRKGNRTARYYLVAWTISVVGVVITALILLGVLEYDFFLYNATFIGVLLDVAFLSFALADRINILRNEKDHARHLVNETLRKTKNELESKVAARTADLRAAKEAADHASSVKSEFLSNMSHELRTPLNSILGFAQLLETDNTPPLSPVQQGNVKHIITSGTHLLSLITDVLDLSRIESGKLALSIESVSLRDSLDSALQLVTNQASEMGIYIEDKTPVEDCYYIQADSTRLTQVIINLLTNGIKYNRRGGSVFISATRIDDNIEIGVKDTGSGMTGEQINRIFDPFERINSDKKGIEGTGIGLTITKRLMNLMKGTISVSSSIKDGSRFTLQLPISEPDQIRQASTSAIEKAADTPIIPDGQHRILYVEDNTLNQKLMRHILSRHENIELIMADCGLEGIEIAKAEKPSMIIMDIRLPDISGYQALKLLKSMSETRTIPTIAVSANATEDDLIKGKQVGFLDYIEKPVDIQRLMEAVTRCLSIQME